MKVLRVVLLLLGSAVFTYGFAQDCSGKPQPNAADAQKAFETWGGSARLNACLATVPAK